MARGGKFSKPSRGGMKRPKAVIYPLSNEKARWKTLQSRRPTVRQARQSSRTMAGKVFAIYTLIANQAELERRRLGPK